MWILLPLQVFLLHCIPFLTASSNNDQFFRDFKLFSKRVCRTGCSRLHCYPGTIISVESVQQVTSPDLEKCPGRSDSLYSAREFGCHFKFIENHVFKTCTNSYKCNLCPDKIRSQVLPNTICTSAHDFYVHYKCIPAVIKNDKVCSNSYLDIDCFNGINERLVIVNATLHAQLTASSDDPRSCDISELVSQSAGGIDSANRHANAGVCNNLDQTRRASLKCFLRPKCSIGPHGFGSGLCRNMHMRISHACVPLPVLKDTSKNEAKLPGQSRNPPWRSTDKPVVLKSAESSWFSEHKWTVLGAAVASMVTVAVVTIIAICVSKRKRSRRRCCHINNPLPKENLFSKLGGQPNFSPPPSSIDKMNIEFDSCQLAPPELYSSTGAGSGSGGTTSNNHNKQQHSFNTNNHNSATGGNTNLAALLPASSMMDHSDSNPDMVAVATISSGSNTDYNHLTDYDPHMRSIYSISKYPHPLPQHALPLHHHHHHNHHQYGPPPPPINACQYFPDSLHHHHQQQTVLGGCGGDRNGGLLEMPSLTLGSRSTANNTSHSSSSSARSRPSNTGGGSSTGHTGGGGLGTPRGTNKSSGIFSMNENSFDNSNLV